MKTNSTRRWLAGAGLLGAAALLGGCAVYGDPNYYDGYGYGPGYYDPGPAVIGVPAYVDIDVYNRPRYWGGRPYPYHGVRPGWGGRHRE